LLNPVSWLVVNALDLYSWIVIAAVIVSWLIVGNVINIHNNIVNVLVRFLDAATEPLFRLVRRILPPIAGIDLSPLVVLFGIWFLRYLVMWITFRTML
jgi:YggT family protein